MARKAGGQTHGLEGTEMCGKAGAWVGGGQNTWSRSLMGVEMHHTSWRVMYCSCWRTMCHERDNDGHGSMNGCVHNMRMRGKGKGELWALAG